jgi:Polysaccharide lyase family 4, domain II
VRIDLKFQPAFHDDRELSKEDSAAWNGWGYQGLRMRSLISRCFLPVFILASAIFAAAQTDYKVISVDDGGTITGTIKWSGPVPHELEFPVTKDPQICEPDGKKTVSLERLIVGPEGGVANTIVYLKNISAGKALELPEQRRHLDQRHCRYVPHILLVPKNAELQMQSSDATLHTIHMDGAATYNLPFPFPNQVSSRNMPTAGLVNLRCNGGHVWMNAEMMVVPHPYYAVTDESGRFTLTDVPPGAYQLVAWHEGWGLAGKEQAYDVLTEHTVQRPLFTEAKTWERSVTVSPRQSSTVNFVIGNK